MRDLKAEAEVEKLRAEVERLKLLKLREAVYDRYNADNATFVAEARKGWPRAIERALEAEELLRDILPMAMWESCRYREHAEADPTTHCCDWNEIAERIGRYQQRRCQTMRDLLKDLELCTKATSGKWISDCSPWDDQIISIPEGDRDGYVRTLFTIDAATSDDIELVTQAREGWPHAIKRALKAEDEVGKLRAELEFLRAQVKNLKWREETILRWLDDSCCPPSSLTRMLGSRCPERACGECFREALDKEEVQGRGQDGDEAHAPNPGASTEGDLYRELGELKAENSMLRVANGLLKRRKKVLDEALTLAVLAQVGVEASEKPDLVKSYPDFRKLVNERKQKYISIAEREPDTSKEGEHGQDDDRMD